VISRRRFLRNTILGGALLGSAALVGRHLSGYHLDPATAARLKALTPKEYLILEAIVRRMLAPDRPDAPSAEVVGAAQFADAYLARLDAGSRADVRALLHLVEHGSGPFRLGLTRFSRMSPEEQDATLADWEHSRLAIRRRGFQAMKMLAMLGYWRADVTWPLIGYTGPILPRPRRAPT
jgi:D-cysteine desulfhydrase